MNKGILSRAMLILLLTGLLVSSVNLDSNQTVKVAGQQEGPNIFEADVPVRGTYLFAEDYTTEWDDNGDGEKDEHNLEAPSVLESYSVPIPESCEKVIYDTGIEKRGLTVFLGEGGKIIHA
jgi:hypothetical protein